MKDAANTPWPKVRLGDIGESLIGLTYRPDDVTSVGTLVLRSSNIRDGHLVFDDNVYVTSSIPGKIRIRENDILICVRNGSRRLIGKSALLDHRVVGETFGAFMAIYRSKANSYLQYFFQVDDFKRQIDAHLGATINQITNNSLNNVVVALPSPTEQRAIADRLMDADRYIATLGQLIAKKQAVGQGMMQQLLTGRSRLPGFSDPWVRTVLGTVGIFQKGRGVKRDDVRSSGVPCIRYGELYTAFSDYTSQARSFVTSDVAATALPLKSGDLLFAGSGETREEIGKCVAYIGPAPAVAGGDVIVLRGDRFNPVYLAMLANMSDVARQRARAGQGNAVVHISSRALAEIEVTLPPREEQDAIAKVIIDVEREIKALERRLAKAEDIKQGMMQELLSGRTRLPVQETAT
jgi:type I restriction enzyme S subunit